MKYKTEYTFEIKRKVTVIVNGRDTERNYSLAREYAVHEVSMGVDEDWLEYYESKEFVDEDAEFDKLQDERA